MAVTTKDTLSQSLAAGMTLPASWYTDPAHFRKEEQRILRRTWHYVARQDQLAQVGDFVTTRVGYVPLILLRDEEGVRAYVNVCGHRGSELVLQPCGNRKSLQCHYHGWTWGLDGQLRAAPRSRQQEKPFNKEDFPLTPVRVESYGPFYFVNLDPEAPSLAEMMGGLPQQIAEARVNPSALRFREQRVYDIAANWKVVVENFLECYHCAVAHQGFSSLIDLDEYQVIPFDFYSIQRGPLKASAEQKEFYDFSDGGQEGIYTFFWPTFMLNSYPGIGNASLNLIQPLSEGRTRAIYEFYFAEEFPEDEAAKLIELIDQVQREDIIICEAVQRGLMSGYYEQGQLMLSHENGIQHFQRLVYNALAQD